MSCSVSRPKTNPDSLVSGWQRLLNAGNYLMTGRVRLGFLPLPSSFKGIITSFILSIGNICS